MYWPSTSFVGSCLRKLPPHENPRPVRRRRTPLLLQRLEPQFDHSSVLPPLSARCARTQEALLTQVLLTARTARLQRPENTSANLRKAQALPFAVWQRLCAKARWSVPRAAEQLCTQELVLRASSRWRRQDRRHPADKVEGMRTVIRAAAFLLLAQSSSNAVACTLCQSDLAQACARERSAGLLAVYRSGDIPLHLGARCGSDHPWPR